MIRRILYLLLVTVILGGLGGAIAFYAFDFKPQYGADSYMAADQPFDSQALFALRRAKWLRVSVDGRELVDAALEGSGFAEVLDAAAACSAGKSGWWGEGAKQP